MLNKFGVMIALATLALFTSGCTNFLGKAGSTLAAPVFGLAVKDANTTLLWIEREAGEGRLSEHDAEFARRCPEALLAVEALRARLEDVEDNEDGFKGLIYYGTINRFGRSLKAEAILRVEDVLGSCMVLFPAEKILKFL